MNVNGLIDLSWVRKYANIKSLLFIGIPGEEGASALAGILTGETNPSGKLAVTIAEHYEDYQTISHGIRSIWRMFLTMRATAFPQKKTEVQVFLKAR